MDVVIGYHDDIASYKYSIPCIFPCNQHICYGYGREISWYNNFIIYCVLDGQPIPINGNRIKSPRKKSPGKNRPEKIPLNAVEREPVPTRIINPNASKASYKPKQRSYRKTKLHFFFRRVFFRGDFVGEIFT